MNYQVLARKWRPQVFKDVIGQQHVLTTLINCLSLKRIHHAYLFSGIRGVGKTTIARLLAKGLNCETEITATPCRECNSCCEIEKGCFIDLIEIDAASRTKVEDTREILDNVQYLPAKGRFKIFLIDEVHMLSRHSFNALLKTLEEPPDYVKFLLATTDPKKLPATIVSRCLQLHLKALEKEQIRNKLRYVIQSEKISSEESAINLLAYASDNSMRDALSLTDQAIAMGNGKITTSNVKEMLGMLDNQQTLALVKAILQADGFRVISLINQVSLLGVNWETLLIDMMTLFHRIAMMQLLPSVITKDTCCIEHSLHELSKNTSPTDIQLYYQTLLMGRKELAMAPSRRMGVEMTLLRALAFHPKIQVFAKSDNLPVIRNKKVKSTTISSDTTENIILARKKLINYETNKSYQNVSKSQSIPSNHSIIDNLSTTIPDKKQIINEEENTIKKTFSSRKTIHSDNVKIEEIDKKNKNLWNLLENKKKSELIKKIMIVAQKKDTWTAEIATLKIPKLVQQLALNAWKEVTQNNICLHLRSSQRHLNSYSTQKILNDALNDSIGHTIELKIIEDDNPIVLTPMEWLQKIYEDKLLQARQSIITDIQVQTLCRFFNADLDYESICLI